MPIDMKNNLKKSGKVLFVIHDNFQDDNKLSLGPAYLVAILRDAGHEVSVYSQNVFHQSNEELGNFLAENDFDMIGLGFLAARYVEAVRPIADVINANKKKAKFVVGGQGVSPIPSYILNDIQADIAMIGEAENNICVLVDAILNNGDLQNIKGVAYREAGVVKINPRAEIVRDLDRLPFPAWDLFPMEEIATCASFVGGDQNDRWMSILTSRGCVNRCSFCYRMEQGIRIRSMDNVYKELKILTEKYEINSFCFDDEMFIPNRARIKEFVEMIKKLKHPIKYWCQARVQLAQDKEILKMLSDSGCKLLNLGLESLDQNVLDLMDKNTRVEENIEAVENTIATGMHPGLNFIWANPGDTVASLEKIVDFLIKYDTQGQLRTVRPPTPYPGCPLYYKAIEDGKLKGPGDFFDRFNNSDRLTVNFTDMSDTEVYQALLAANTKLIKNYFIKKTGNVADADVMIDSFKRLYFPERPEDLKFRGARRYAKKVNNDKK